MLTHYDFRKVITSPECQILIVYYERWERRFYSLCTTVPLSSKPRETGHHKSVHKHLWRIRIRILNQKTEVLPLNQVGYIFTYFFIFTIVHWENVKKYIYFNLWISAKLRRIYPIEIISTELWFICVVISSISSLNGRSYFRNYDIHKGSLQL